MTETIYIKPLGKILQEASLISAPQIQVALHDRNLYQDLRIGEILALRGWIEQDTADFFAEEWSDIVVKQHNLHPIGYYLRQAALLDEKQIKIILQEQKQLWLRFGSVAILKGWLKQETLDFFLSNLFPGAFRDSPFIGKQANGAATSNNHLDLKATLLQVTQKKIDDEDIPWID